MTSHARKADCPATLRFKVGALRPQGLEILDAETGRLVALIVDKERASRIAPLFSESPGMLYALGRVRQFLRENFAADDRAQPLRRLLRELCEQITGRS